MEPDAVARFAASIVTLTNPIGNAALFVGMTTGWPGADRRSAAITCMLASAVILVTVTWAGESILGFFGISVAALKTTGGLIIAMIGLSMLHARTSRVHTTNEEREEAKNSQAIGIVPLAMPIVAGPGTMAAIIVATHKYSGAQSNFTISVVCIAAAALVGVCFLMAVPLCRVLGVSGVNILTRFMGLILTAIAVGMLASGLKGLLPGLAT